MIPVFNEYGYLPPGIHLATLEEVAARFGQVSELRRVQMESLRWLVDLARRAGVQRVIVNGSFVTDIIEPNDVDCVLLAGPMFTEDPAALEELEDGLPFIQMEVLMEIAFQGMVQRTFASDRNTVPKGMIEVSL